MTGSFGVFLVLGEGSRRFLLLRGYDFFILGFFG